LRNPKIRYVYKKKDHAIGQNINLSETEVVIKVKVRVLEIF